mmetsp:Transcript_7239/g.10599  ORF Transcript_7239/g.10599 Transcript_7239/m.10599 type:complete len:89 (+) Transcript_7239:74-340(+)
MTPSSTPATHVNSSDQQSIREMSRSLRRIKRRMFLQAVQNDSHDPADKLREMLLSIALQPDSSSSIHSSPSFQSSCSSMESIEEEDYD